MVSAHSPLPPPLPATLETISGRLDHAITVIELTAQQVQKLDDARMETARVEASMRKIALKLSASAMSLSAARVVAAMALPARSIAVMAAGAFGGGFVGSILWQMLHAHSAMAGVLP